MKKILVVDDDRDVAELVRAVLTDECYTVSVLNTVSADAIRVIVNQWEPDCVLLDSERAGDFGGSWETAAWLRRRSRPIPTIMFTGHRRAAEEAEESSTDRSRAAAFAGVLLKPFDLDRMLALISRCVGSTPPFADSPEANSARTQLLLEKLRAAGATDIHTSTRREWVSFRTPDGTLVQLYWWQRDGVYYVMRHAETGGKIDQIGALYDLDTAISVAMQVRAA
jgi:CheY-like chemotaxis protein